MKMFFTAVVLSLVALAAMTSSPASAETKVLDTYCSPTGDFCQGLFRKSGRVRAELSTFSFRGEVELCVNPPGGSTNCKDFRLRSSSQGIYKSSVALSKHFDLRGRGRYSVAWKQSGFRIGTKLHFRKG